MFFRPTRTRFTTCGASANYRSMSTFEAKLTDARERERLARLFERTLGDAVGYVLPLARADEGDGWRSSPWFLRRERCYLIPGDSPLGYRLPLDSQPWVRPGDFPHVISAGPDPELCGSRPMRRVRQQVQSAAGCRRC